MVLAGEPPGAALRRSVRSVLNAMALCVVRAATERPMALDRVSPGSPDSIEAFEVFYRTFEPRIFGYLWRMSGNEHDALDMTQETFLRAWQRFTHLRAYQRPDSWLFRVATHLALNHARQRERYGRALARLQASEVPASDEIPIEFAERDEVMRTLQMLPARDRAVLVLHSVYGLTCAELAAALHISPGAAKVLLWRGRERFRRNYAQAEEDA